MVGLGSLSVAKTEQAIDYWVDRYDPHALRRSELGVQGRHVDVVAERDGAGLSWIDATLFSHDAAAPDERRDWDGAGGLRCRSAHCGAASR